MTDRETMQQIMQVLGPVAVCKCAGCNWETTEALRLLNEAGITYQPFNARLQPAHEPDRERLGGVSSLPEPEPQRPGERWDGPGTGRR